MSGQPDRESVQGAHREDLEGVMDLLRVAIQLDSRCEYGDGPGGSQQNRSAFLAHFHDLRAPLAEWNARVEEVEAAPGALWGWLARATTERGIAEPPFSVGALIDRLAILTSERARQERLDVPHRLYFERFRDRSAEGERVSVYVEGQNAVWLASDPPETLEERIEGAESAIQALFDDAQRSEAAQEVVGARDALLDLKQPLLDRLAEQASHDVILIAADCPVCGAPPAPDPTG